MKLFRCCLLAVAFPFLASGAVLTLPHQEKTLPNGLKIYLVKYPVKNVIAFQIPVRVGSRNEVERGKTGFAHFFEHLMFRGTKQLSGKAFSELYTKKGADNNAYTWLDITNYHASLSLAALPEILAAEADRFANLSFLETEMKDEAGAVLSEYNKNNAQPESQLDEKLVETAFSVHPYSHTTIGYKEDILNYDKRYDDVWTFFRRHYRPGNTSIIIVGDVDFDREMALVTRLFSDWKAPGDSPEVAIPAEPEQKAPRTATVALGKPTQTRLAIAYKVPAFTTANTDFASLQLLAEMTFSLTSEFQKTFRYERKWLDAVSAPPLETIDPYLWTIQLRLAQAGEGHEAELIAAVENAVQRLREKEVDPKRLEATRARFRNFAKTSWFQDPDALAGRIAWFTNLEPDIGVIDRVFSRIDEVTPTVLKAFATKHLIDNHKTVVSLHGGKP